MRVVALVTGDLELTANSSLEHIGKHLVHTKPTVVFIIALPTTNRGFFSPHAQLKR
jgi:hypothetical protein